MISLVKDFSSQTDSSAYSKTTSTGPETELSRQEC